MPYIIAVFSFVLFFCISAVLAEKNTGYGFPDTGWNGINDIEVDLEIWAKNQGEDALVEWGRERDENQPREVVLIRAFFPYLLPEGFFNRNMEADCLPDFQTFREMRDTESYTRWKFCIDVLYRDETPDIYRRAFHSLKPGSAKEKSGE